MPRYAIIAHIEAPDDAAALCVAAERLGHDENYGFDYTIERVETFATPEGDRRSKMGGSIHVSFPDGRSVYGLRRQIDRGGAR